MSKKKKPEPSFLSGDLGVEKKKRYQCSECEKSYQELGKGRVFLQHQLPGGGMCPGSGKPPREEGST